MFQLEKQLENIGVRSQKELILLHREDPAKGYRISHTVDWLNARGWICAHHHVRLHFMQSINESCWLLVMKCNITVISTFGLSPTVLGVQLFVLPQGSSSKLYNFCTVAFQDMQFHVSFRSLQSLSGIQLRVKFGLFGGSDNILSDA